MGDVIDLRSRRRKRYESSLNQTSGGKISRENKIRDALSKWGSYNGTESLERNKSKIKDEKDDADFNTD